MKTQIINHQAFQDITLLDSNFFFNLFNVTSIDELSKNIESVSDHYAKYKYVDIINPDGTYKTRGKNKIKGDLFEIFAESFYKIVGNDPTICVHNYTPIPSLNDHGVDAQATNNEDNELTISVKYRTRGKRNTLTMTDLGQFVVRSQNYHSIPTKTRNRMIVFTTFDGISPYSDAEITPIMTVHGYDTIKYHTENSNGFWRELSALIENSIEFHGI